MNNPYTSPLADPNGPTQTGKNHDSRNLLLDVSGRRCAIGVLVAKPNVSGCDKTRTKGGDMKFKTTADIRPTVDTSCHRAHSDRPASAAHGVKTASAFVQLRRVLDGRFSLWVSR